MLRPVLNTNPKLWEDCLPHATTHMCPLQIVYGFIPSAPIDLIHTPPSDNVNFDAEKRAQLSDFMTFSY